MTNDHFLHLNHSLLTSPHLFDSYAQVYTKVLIDWYQCRKKTHGFIIEYFTCSILYHRKYNICFIVSFSKLFFYKKKMIISFTYPLTRDIESTNYKYYVSTLFSFIYTYIYFYFPHVDKDSKEKEENSKKSKSLSRGSIRTDLIFNQFSALISNKRNVCPSFRRSRKNFVSSSARRQVIVKNNFYTIRTRWIVRIPSCYVLANSPGCLQVSTRRNRTFDSERIIRLRQQSFIVMEEFLFSSLAFILSTENFI